MALTYATDAHYIGLTVCLSVSAVLSLTGDACIIYRIVKGKKIDKLYHRLMLAISISDIVFTLAALLSPYMMPSVTGIVTARGNTASCSASAAFIIAGVLAVSSYCSQLSCYYRLMIRHGYSEETLARRFEKPAHLVTFLIIIVFVSVCLALEGFNPNKLRNACFIEYLPQDCFDNDSVECTRGLYAIELAHCLAALVLAYLLVALVNTFLVYWTVRQFTRKCDRRASRRNSHVGDQMFRRERRVAVQACLYMLAYLNTFLWVASTAFVYSLVVPSGEKPGNGIYAYHCLWVFFVLLQGFLNFFVYIRPRYLQWNENHSEKSWLWALRKAVFDVNPPPTAISSRRTSSPPLHTSRASSSSGMKRGTSSFKKGQSIPPSFKREQSVTTNVSVEKEQEEC